MPITEAERDTIRSYDAIAEARRGSVTTNINFWKDKFLDLVSKKDRQRFLDLGCGDGRDAALFQSIFGNLDGYIGLDHSAGMLQSVFGRQLVDQIAVTKGEVFSVPLVEADIYSLPLASKSIDIVWAAASLIHTPREQIQEQLAEIVRCLTLGGQAFFVMKYGEGERWETGSLPEDKRYVVFWGADNFREELEKAGFFVNFMGISTIRDNRGISWLYAVATKRT